MSFADLSVRRVAAPGLVIAATSGWVLLLPTVALIAVAVALWPLRRADPF